MSEGFRDNFDLVEELMAQEEQDQWAEICLNCGSLCDIEKPVCPRCKFDRKRTMVAAELRYADLFWNEFPAEKNKKGDIMPPYEEANISYWMLEAHWVKEYGYNVTIRRYPRSISVSYSYSPEAYSDADYTYTMDGDGDGIVPLEARIFKAWLKTTHEDFEKLFPVYMAELSVELKQGIEYGD